MTDEVREETTEVTALSLGRAEPIVPVVAETVTESYRVEGSNSIEVVVDRADKE